jgi:hypothetical protein
MKVGWFTVIAPHLMTLADAEGHRIDLAVIPPETTEAVAQRALAVASGSSVMSAEQILETSGAQIALPPNRDDNRSADKALVTMASA